MFYSKIFLALILIPASFCFHRYHETAEKDFGFGSEQDFFQKSALIKCKNVYSFEENLGQEERDILFVSKMNGKRVYLHKDKFEVSSMINSKISIEFGNSDIKRVVGINPLKKKSNYFIGAQKISGVNHFEKVEYSGIYPNIDLIFYFNEDDELEFDFLIHPGGNFEDITSNRKRERKNL